MKNIVKSFVALALIAGFTSCEDEQDLLFSQPEASFRILSPTSGDGVVLSPATPTNPGLSLTWEDADYGTPTEVTYTVQVDKNGDDFDSPIDLVSTTNTFATITSDALNGASAAAGLAPFSEGGLEIRVKSTVGTTGSQPLFSEVITYLVTPYSTELPKLGVPGNHQEWDPASSPRIASSSFGETDYEGYMWLDGGFKFVAPNASGNFTWDTNWGDDGTFSGALLSNSPDNCTATAGYYRVKADTDALTYSVAPVSWGIIGYATTGSDAGWNQDVDLTYNPTTKKLELASIALSPGAFKFRGNNAWSNGFDLGTVNADGYLVDGGDLTFAGPAGNYKVILDLSNPRKYTYELIAL